MSFNLTKKGATGSMQRDERSTGETENECFRMDDEDNVDLSTMLQNVAKEKVPDEMACLCEQQKKII